MVCNKVSMKYEAKEYTIVSHVMNVIADRHPMVPHFFFFGQLTAFMGSSGPSQSTILGSLVSTCCLGVPFSSSTFSISLEYLSSLGSVSENDGFDFPFSPLRAGFDSADKKEVEDDGRSGMLPSVAAEVISLSCSFSCTSELWLVDEMFCPCSGTAAKRQHPEVSRRSIVQIALGMAVKLRLGSKQATYKGSPPSLLVP